jgi:hypothetical protein
MTDDEANIPHLDNVRVDARPPPADPSASVTSDAAGAAAPSDAADEVTSFLDHAAGSVRPGTSRPAPSVNNFFAEGNLPNLADEHHEGAPGLSPDLRSLRERHAAAHQHQTAFTSVPPGGFTSPQRPLLQRKLARRVSDIITLNWASSVCVRRVLFAVLALVLLTACALGFVFLMPGSGRALLQALQAVPSCVTEST